MAQIKAFKGGVKMRYRTDDPHADFDRWEADQQRELDKLPKCEYCGKPITDDHLFNINGDILCESCLNKNFKKPVEDYMD